MAEVKVCEECMRRAIMWRPIKVYLKHYDADSYERDLWVCEHYVSPRGDC